MQKQRLCDYIANAEREYILGTITELMGEHPAWTLSEARLRAAEMLGISLATLYRKCPPFSDGAAGTGLGGRVYVMHHERSGMCKIGFTRHRVLSREKTLQAQEPGISLVLSFPGSMLDERRLHQRYASKRKRGEWFKLTKRDLAEIERNFVVPSDVVGAIRDEVSGPDVN